MDYQIWCGPSMGAFNDWVRGTYLEQPQNRRVVDVAYHMMTGAAFLYRIQQMLRYYFFKSEDSVRIRKLDFSAIFAYYYVCGR